MTCGVIRAQKGVDELLAIISRRGVDELLANISRWGADELIGIFIAEPVLNNLA